ncbi:MAG TPA: 2OG-Fe(II) oxygenase [Caulobacteraceae bacterium]|nr:2OG-Fe(II) oxygenase [Caulobacteraceae bacterium]
MSVLNWPAIEAVRLSQDPFAHFLVPQSLKPACAHALLQDYPAIHSPGSFSLADAPPGPALASLILDLQSPRFRTEMERIFAIDLANKPTTVTLRGQCSPRDGRIHTDSRSKVLSLLLYLNDGWESPEGRLRLLRKMNDIDDYAVEVPPTFGTLVGFQRSDLSWHGHTRFAGPRRVLQFNYVQSARSSFVVDLRHRLSALAKQRS